MIEEARDVLLGDGVDIDTTKTGRMVVRQQWDKQKKHYNINQFLIENEYHKTVRKMYDQIQGPERAKELIKMLDGRDLGEEFDGEYNDALGILYDEKGEIGRAHV